MYLPILIIKNSEKKNPQKEGAAHSCIPAMNERVCDVQKGRDNSTPITIAKG